ncbi:MAG TPA: flagellin [Vicinamibacterales bacterium]|nr:flagellin [Vicinamibacterales bacterium]
MRVTFDIVRDGLSSIQTAATSLSEAQLQVASGKRLRVPSDDPLGTRLAVGEHTSIGAIDSYTRSVDSAASRLAAADGTLTDIIDKLTSAIAATTGARGTTSDPASRLAAAATLGGLRDALARDINTRFDGTALFGGTRVDQTPYVQDPVTGVWTYQGDNAQVQVEVEQGHRVAIATDGSSIFQGSDPDNVLNVLEGLITAVTTNNQAAMATGIADLQRTFDRATQAQSRVGADEVGIADAASRLSGLKLAAETRRSKVEDANMAEAIARMNRADTAYRAALSAVSQAERQSLLDYLR